MNSPTRVTVPFPPKFLLLVRSGLGRLTTLGMLQFPCYNVNWDFIDSAFLWSHPSLAHQALPCGWELAHCSSPRDIVGLVSFPSRTTWPSDQAACPHAHKDWRSRISLYPIYRNIWLLWSSLSLHFSLRFYARCTTRCPSMSFWAVWTDLLSTLSRHGWPFTCRTSRTVCHVFPEKPF